MELLQYFDTSIHTIHTRTHTFIVGWITLGWLKLYKINMNFGWMNIFITV